MSLPIRHPTRAARDLAPLGAGGMGEVYRARDTRLGRDVAIEVLPAAFTEHRERLERFTREAQLLAQLHHPNIVDGVRPRRVDGRPGTRDGVGRGRRPVGAHCPRADSARRGIVDRETNRRGPRSTHREHGIIDRELKAGERQGASRRCRKSARLRSRQSARTENGTSADLDAARSPTLTANATRIGAVLGTAAYMAPEQARGKVVDRPVDIWAFGLVLYEMLTGRRAFAGEDSTDVIAARCCARRWTGRRCPLTRRRGCDGCWRAVSSRPETPPAYIGEARVVLEDPPHDASEQAGSGRSAGRCSGRRAHAGGRSLAVAAAVAMLTLGFAIGRFAGGFPAPARPLRPRLLLPSSASPSNRATSSAPASLRTDRRCS